MFEKAGFNMHLLVLTFVFSMNKPHMDPESYLKFFQIWYITLRVIWQDLESADKAQLLWGNSSILLWVYTSTSSKIENKSCTYLWI